MYASISRFFFLLLLCASILTATNQKFGCSNLSGIWCDQSGQCTLQVNHTADGRLSVMIPSSKTIATGHVFITNRTVVLNFPLSPPIHSTGVIPLKLPMDCTNITWTDPPDLKAHNSWCKTPWCAVFPPDSLPSYPSLHGGGFTSPLVPESPDPLVNYRWDATTPLELQVYTQHPKEIVAVHPSASFQHLEALLQNHSKQILSHQAQVLGSGSFTVDFGSENACWLEIDSEDLPFATQNGVKLWLSISEYNEPGFYNTINGIDLNNKTALARHVGGNSSITYRLELNSELYEGVRYGFVHIEYTGDTISSFPHFTISSMRTVCQILPVNYIGSFHINTPSPKISDDLSLISQVWWTGVFTVKLNLMPTFFNSILIDRGDRISWTGDAHLSQKTALVSFGNYKAVKNNIDRTSGPHGYNGIASYALYWVMSLYDYFLWSGDEKALLQYAEEVHGKIQKALSFWDKPFKLTFYGSDERIGACFENADIPEAQQTYRLLGLQVTDLWYRAVNSCSICQSIMANASALMVRRQQLIIKLRNSTNPIALGIHSAAGVMSAKFTTAQEDRILLHHFADPIQHCSFSPFNTYFLISSLADAHMRWKNNSITNRNEDYLDPMCIALQMVEDCWGGMIQLGATTFWETYSPEWNRAANAGPFGYNDPTPNGQTGYMSRCHPWASGATPFLTKHILGIEAIKPGFKQFQISPWLNLNKTIECNVVIAHVNGSVPTPYGTLSASFMANSSGIEAQIRIPCIDSKHREKKKCTQGLIALPKLGLVNVVHTITVNGVKQAVQQDQQDINAVYVKVMGDSAVDMWKIQMSYAHNLDKFEKRNENQSVVHDTLIPKSYAGKFLGNDTITQGNWCQDYENKTVNKDSSQKVYGTKGYRLYSFNGVGEHLDHLPSFIQQIKTGMGGSHNIHYSIKNDTRGLIDPTGGHRQLGALSTSGPGACRQSIVLDVVLKNVAQGVNMNISLYFVDFEYFSRRLAVEVRDLNTLHIVVPTTLLTHFQDGVYLSYAYNASMRFRIMEITGELPHNDADAVLSAIFFD